MTRLRPMMLGEPERRNYSQGTIRCYLRAVADFARYSDRCPDELRPEQVREYQAYLFRERKLDASSVTQQLAALRFFFRKTLKKRWTTATESCLAGASTERMRTATQGVSSVPHNLGI